MRVLVVEDHLELQENIAAYLQPDMELDFASSGPEGLALALANPYDVLVLDVMLPGFDGVELCRRYRAHAPRLVPVLMLTAMDTLEAKEAGFGAGADDYLVKPFSLRELRLRITALARRPVPPSGRTLTLGRLELDPESGRVRVGGAEARLPRAEVSILRMLMEAAPGAVSSRALAERLWGEETPESSVLRTHVYGLRKTLARLGAEGAVVTRPQEGYGLDVRAL
jgi:DNA-binding response OmpR family regulator